MSLEVSELPAVYTSYNVSFSLVQAFLSGAFKILHVFHIFPPCDMSPRPCRNRIEQQENVGFFLWCGALGYMKLLTRAVTSLQFESFESRQLKLESRLARYQPNLLGIHLTFACI